MNDAKGLFASLNVILGKGGRNGGHFQLPAYMGGPVPGLRAAGGAPSTHLRTNDPPVDMAEAGCAPPDATVGAMSREDLRGAAPCSPGYLLGDVDRAIEPFRLP